MLLILVSAGLFLEIEYDNYDYFEKETVYLWITAILFTLPICVMIAWLVDAFYNLKQNESTQYKINTRQVVIQSATYVLLACSDLVIFTTFFRGYSSQVNFAVFLSTLTFNSIGFLLLTYVLYTILDLQIKST
jgi:hypothetical protein